MDNQRNNNPLLSFAYYCQGKSMEDLRQSLLYTTLELEQTRVAVQEELRKRDDQLLHLKDLLNKVIRERDDAQEQCQRLVFDKLLLQQHQQQVAPLSGISSIEDEPRRGGIDSSTNNNGGFSSSDCEESIVSSPVIDHHHPTIPIPIQPHPPQLLPPPPQSAPAPAATTTEVMLEKPLPEKGKLLQAVMKAGPLLQTLLLAGPLPQWRHPPPPLESFEIPPVTIPSPPQLLHHHQDNSNSNSFINNNINSLNNCGKINRKRGFPDDSPTTTETKYQRVLLP